MIPRHVADQLRRQAEDQLRRQAETGYPSSQMMDVDSSGRAPTSENPSGRYEEVCAYCVRYVHPPVRYVDVRRCGGWVIVPEEIEGRNFVNIDFGRQCKEFLGNHFSMVNYITKLRNRKVAELTAESAQDDDPKDPKPLPRELMERIPNIITIDVVTRTGWKTTVGVLPS